MEKNVMTKVANSVSVVQNASSPGSYS